MKKNTTNNSLPFSALLLGPREKQVRQPKEEKEKENKMIVCRDFLKDEYAIRINRFNPDQKEVVPKNREYGFLPTLNDINLHFMEERGYSAKSILKDLLNSPNFMDIYDPVKEYFDSLEYRGTSHIDLMLACLTPKLTDGMKLERLNERMFYIIKKWIVASYACSVHGIDNHVSLGFISEKEGIGKTRLARFLVPPRLGDMIQTANDKDGLFDFDKAFAFNFIVLFDECVGMNNRTAETFKNKVTSKTCTVKYAGQFTPTDVPRIGNAIFTSNNKTGKNKGFLTESLGYRRYGCVELDYINMDLFDKVNVDQIWAEAKTLYKGGYDSMWNNADFDEFKEFNIKYSLVTNVIKIIQDYFDIPDSKTEAELMSSSQIYDYLKNLSGAHRLGSDQRRFLNKEEIGKGLSSLGFVQTRNNKQRMYKVKKKYTF